MSMNIVDNEYQQPVHPNTRKCSNDGVHINKPFIDEVQNNVEALMNEQNKSDPIHLTFQRAIFNDPHNWELHFTDIPHNKLFIVKHFFDNPYYTRALIDSLDDQTYSIETYTLSDDVKESKDIAVNDVTKDLGTISTDIKLIERISVILRGYVRNRMDIEPSFRLIGYDPLDNGTGATVKLFDFTMEILYVVTESSGKLTLEILDVSCPEYLGDMDQYDDDGHKKLSD